MNLLKAAQRTVSLSIDGMREAVTAVAERVAVRVRIGKLHLQSQDAEARLEQAYKSLGQHLFANRELSDPTNTILPPLQERIRSERQTLLELRDKLASQYDEALAASLLRLQEDLKEGGAMVERVTVSPGAHADGKVLRALALPEEVRLVFIRRSNCSMIPSPDLILKAGDQITLIGKRSAVPEALHILRN
ncbi:MAG: hypothetical protein E6K60_06305 [Nitrospirae bacterium]|nr:MAG: hypothetical protein E6K60_06305 [Nitrospirota bacterium]